jgi:hypothetical protein
MSIYLRDCIKIIFDFFIGWFQVSIRVQYNLLYHDCFESILPPFSSWLNTILPIEQSDLRCVQRSFRYDNWTFKAYFIVSMESQSTDTAWSLQKDLWFSLLLYDCIISINMYEKSSNAYEVKNARFYLPTNIRFKYHIYIKPILQ